MILKSTLSRARVDDGFWFILTEKTELEVGYRRPSLDLEDSWRRQVQRRRQSQRTYPRLYSSTERQMPERKSERFRLCRDGSPAWASESRVSAQGQDQRHRSGQDGV